MVQELRGESILPAYILLLPSHFIIIIFFYFNYAYRNYIATRLRHIVNIDPFWRKILGQTLFGKKIWGKSFLEKESTEKVFIFFIFIRIPTKSFSMKQSPFWRKNLGQGLLEEGSTWTTGLLRYNVIK